MTITISASAPSTLVVAAGGAVGPQGAAGVVQSVNGHSAAAVTLTAADVAAVPTTSLGVASGVATLDTAAKLTVSQVPLVVAVPAPTGVPATDQANITAAIAALGSTPGLVQLQAGTYVVPAPVNPANGCVTLTVNGMTLAGMGMGTTTIQLSAGSTGVTGIVRTPSGIQNSKITVRDLTIDGNAAGQTGLPTVTGFFCGVTPNSTLTDTDITLLRVEAMNCIGYGFDPHERTTRLLMVGCVAHDNGSDGAHDGITLDACYDGALIACTAYSNGRHGFNLVTASTRMTLSGCEAYSNGTGGSGNGFTLQNGAKYNTLTGCRAYSHPNGSAYVINGVAQVGQQDNTPGIANKLTGCMASTTGRHSVQLVGASYNTVLGFTSTDPSQTTTNTYDHVSLDETGTSYSTGNTIQDCLLTTTSGVVNVAKYGVAETTSNDTSNLVTGNQISGTGTAALNLLGSTSLTMAAHNGSLGAHPSSFAYTSNDPTGRGYAEWNFSPDVAGASAGAAMVGGTCYGMLLKCFTAGTTTGAVMTVGTLGSTLTLNECLVAVYDYATGTQLAITGDQSVTWTTTGVKAMPFTATFTRTAGQVLYVAALANGTTPPSMVRSSSTSVTTPNAGLTPTTGLRFSVIGTGLTAMPATVTPSATTGTGAITFWVALY